MFGNNALELPDLDCICVGVCLWDEALFINDFTHIMIFIVDSSIACGLASSLLADKLYCPFPSEW